MARGAERYALDGITRIGMYHVIGGDQLRDVYEVFWGSGLARARIGHTVILTRGTARGPPGLHPSADVSTEHAWLARA